jgi:predicted RNA-binding Zn-ribbon protein involved in translation (DUF1610 family)
MQEQDSAANGAENAEQAGNGHPQDSTGSNQSSSRRPHCPYCGSDNVRLSTKQSKIRLVSRYRCRKCGHHFEVSAGHATKSASSRHGHSRSKRGLIIGGVLLIVALLALGVFASLRHEQSASKPVESKASASAPEAKGDPASAFARGMHFYEALEYRESFNWFRNAANMGHGEAMYFLAKSYRKGQGTVQNYRFAFEYMKKAAFKGVEKAQFDLAYMYRDGVGTLQDERTAYAWLNILGARGNEEAALDRNRLSTLMAPSDVEAAQELSMKLIEELKTSVMSVGNGDTPALGGMQMPEGVQAPMPAPAPIGVSTP